MFPEHISNPFPFISIIQPENVGRNVGRKFPNTSTLGKHKFKVHCRNTLPTQMWTGRQFSNYRLAVSRARPYLRKIVIRHFFKIVVDGPLRFRFHRNSIYLHYQFQLLHSSHVGTQKYPFPYDLLNSLGVKKVFQSQRLAAVKA